MKWLKMKEEAYRSHFEYLTRDQLELKLLTCDKMQSHDLTRWESGVRLSGISSESMDYLC